MEVQISLAGRRNSRGEKMMREDSGKSERKLEAMPQSLELICFVMGSHLARCILGSSFWSQWSQQTAN